MRNDVDGGNVEQVSGGAALEKEHRFDLLEFSSEEERSAFIKACDVEGDDIEGDDTRGAGPLQRVNGHDDDEQSIDAERSE